MKAELMKNANIAALILKEKSPTIMTFAGVAGLIGAGVWACRSTIKAQEIVYTAKADIDDVKEDYSEDLNSKEYKKELTKTYVKTGKDLIKVYAGPVIIATLSAGMIFAAENKHRERYASVAAAYTTVDSMFRKYRENVIERFDEQTDKELRYGLKKKKFEIEETDPETGKTKKVKKEVAVVDDPNTYSDYARFYDESCREWDKDPEYNMMKLKTAQNTANEILKSRGYLYLNEVYLMLGIPVTRAGQRVGWFRGFGDNMDGDGYVDFGIYDTNRERVRAFVNGYEPVILLDFNVDGIIDQKVEEYEEELRAQRIRLMQI